MKVRSLMRSQRLPLWQKACIAACSVYLGGAGFSPLPAFAEQEMATPTTLSSSLAQHAACPAPARVPTPADIMQLLKSGTDHGFLWKISKNGHHSWLYGTMHIARFEWLIPGPLTRQAFKASTMVAVELVLSDPQTLAVLQRPASNERLQHLLETGRRQKLDTEAQKQCLPAQALQKLPGSIEAASLMALSGRADGLYPDYAIDAILQTFAKAAHKPLVALETAEAQVSLLTGKTQAEEDELIDSALQDLNSSTGQAELTKLAAMWGNSDLAKLNSYRDWCQCERTPTEARQIKAMLDDRNVLMAEKIEHLHESGQSVFVAVGALHMSGPMGLPALLQKAGYSVQTVLPAAAPL